MKVSLAQEAAHLRTEMHHELKSKEDAAERREEILVARVKASEKQEASAAAEAEHSATVLALRQKEGRDARTERRMQEKLAAAQRLAAARTRELAAVRDADAAKARELAALRAADEQDHATADSANAQLVVKALREGPRRTRATHTTHTAGGDLKVAVRGALVGAEREDDAEVARREERAKLETFEEGLQRKEAAAVAKVEATGRAAASGSGRARGGAGGRAG
ncbi:hypothetical protein T484DRAFT_1798520 [Baffinella frigidus]|nr:hypothetical protein T484DRAFT_1798520 [Cryptophyta sp. CCMP2293]